MTPLNVASFYVDRHEDYPDAVDYVPLLLALERSCRRIRRCYHTVLSDQRTIEREDMRRWIYQGDLHLDEGGLVIGPRGGPLTFTTSKFLEDWPTDLPLNLMRALTESQARHLETRAKWNPMGSDIVFVGADCLVLRDFREFLPPADLSIILRPGHKKHRINNGFMFIPAASIAKVAPLFRQIADSCGEVMCDDMVAVERALAPMPADYGLAERAGLTVNFLPMGVWNAGPRSADDPATGAHVLHFRGRERKAVMLEWAARWLP